jgi:hypothetical protein
MNMLYNLARQRFAQGNINWNSDDIRAILVSAAYAPNQDTHEFLSDIAAGNRIGSAVALANKTSVLGVLDADDVTFTSVPGGTDARAVVLYRHNASENAAALIAYLDGRFRLTIAANTSSQAAFTVDPLSFAVANSAVLTRISGSGPASVTLSSSGGGAAGARTLTANTNVSMVQGDVYEANISGANLPITPNGGNINLTWDNGANKILRL